MNMINILRNICLASISFYDLFMQNVRWHKADRCSPSRAHSLLLGVFVHLSFECVYFSSVLEYFAKRKNAFATVNLFVCNIRIYCKAAKMNAISWSKTYSPNQFLFDLYGNWKWQEKRPIEMRGRECASDRTSDGKREKKKELLSNALAGFMETKRIADHQKDSW